jgi:hypothetical protein
VVVVARLPLLWGRCCSVPLLLLLLLLLLPRHTFPSGSHHVAGRQAWAEVDRQESSSKLKGSMCSSVFQVYCCLMPLLPSSAVAVGDMTMSDVRCASLMVECNLIHTPARRLHLRQSSTGAAVFVLLGMRAPGAAAVHQPPCQPAMFAAELQ